MPPPLAMALIVAGVLNLATGLLYAWDKHAARTQRWRVPEKTLLGMGLFGGWPGAWLSMALVRHKTSKLSFKLKLAAVTLLWLAAAGGVAWWQLSGS